MEIVNSMYSFKEFNKFIGIAIFEHLDINKGVEYKFMKDLSRKDIQVIIFHEIEPSHEFDEYSLIIKCLDETLVRVYKPTVFTFREEMPFDDLYEECKKSDYIEYRYKKIPH